MGKSKDNESMMYEAMFGSRRERERLAKRRLLPSDISEILSEDDEWTVRWALAGNSSIGEGVAERLSRDDEWTVRRALAGNSSIGEGVAERLSRDEVWVVKMTLAKNAVLTPDFLVSFFKSEAASNNPDSNVMLRLLDDDKFPLSFLRDFLSTGGKLALDLLPKCRRTPKDLLELIYAISRDMVGGDKREVDFYLSSNRNTPPYILMDIALHGSCSPVLVNPNTPEEGLRHAYVAFNSSPNVFRNTNCPCDLLEKGMRNSSYEVRAIVASNPRFTGDMIERLLEEENTKTVALKCALNGNCKTESLLSIVSKFPKSKAFRAAMRELKKRGASAVDTSRQ